MTDCVVIGGGIAGLVAAAELCRCGYSVSLIERKPFLGGRAFSFKDPLSGDVLDNGQHLLMGCYTATLRFLEMIGAQTSLDRIERLRIPFRHRDGRTASLKRGRLPHPFGLLQAFLHYEILSWRERMNIIVAAWSLKRLNAAALHALDSYTVAYWLKAHGQSESATEFFWRPLVLATMNTDVHDASAKLFAVVFREVFLGQKEHSSLLLPNVGLSDVFATKAVEYIENLQGSIHVRTDVTGLRHEGDNILIETDAGIFSSRSVITAVAPWHIDSVLGDGMNRSFVRFIPSPILSIHVWSKAKITDEPMTGLFGTNTQWIFFKGKSKDETWLYSCTISAAQGIADMSQSEIEKMVVEEICVHFPWITPSHIARVKAIKERAATFTPQPGLEQFRPKASSAIRGVFIAGDWTATELPATIESAARSGFIAASEVQRFLQCEYEDFTNHELRTSTVE